MSTISAGTTSTTTLQASGDTAGTLVFKTNDTGSGGTTALTLATDQTATFASSISTTAISGTVVATQANQETATSTTTVVSPGRQQYHPSAAKAWVQFQPNGTIERAYNVSSITDNGTGNFTVNFTTNFSNAQYAASATSKSVSDIWGQVYNSTVGQTSSQCQVAYVLGNRSLADPDTGYAIFFGDQ